MKYKIISGKYETGTEEQKATFANMLGTSDIQYKFDLYFHWYNVIHEFGHCLLDSYGIDMDNVDEEFWVNRFAIAYWKKADSSGKLSELKELLEQTIELMPNPVPNGQAYIDFFKSIWQSMWEKGEQQAAMLYGYFQFSCVLEAMKCNDDLCTLLQEVGISVTNCGQLEQYHGKVSAESAGDVLNICIKNLKELGISTVDVEMELTDNPGVHCAKAI